MSDASENTPLIDQLHAKCVKNDLVLNADFASSSRLKLRTKRADCVLMLRSARSDLVINPVKLAARLRTGVLLSPSYRCATSKWSDEVLKDDPVRPQRYKQRIEGAAVEARTTSRASKTRSWVCSSCSIEARSMSMTLLANSARGVATVVRGGCRKSQR